MTLLDTIGLAISNLWRRKMRTFLTVLGVIIGTACIIIMVALGLGSLEQFNESVMQSNDLTRIEVYSAGYGSGDGQPKLNDATLEEIKLLPNGKSATGLLDLPGYMLMGRYECSNSVYGVDPDAMDFEFMEGEVFSNSSEVEIVMGAGTRQYFYDPRDTSDMYGGGMMYSSGVYYEDEEWEEPTGPDVDWLDQQLKFYPYWYADEDFEATPETPAPKQYRASISGVLKQSDDMNNYSMYISMDTAKRLIRENRKLMDSMSIKEDTYSQMYVNATDIDSVDAILQSIKEMGFQVYSPTEWISQMQSEYARQQALLLAIAMISLLVSAIGIANTMLASILERRREIGVMKVIGLSISKINLMFLVEAALIGLLGGLIAIALSYILAAIVNAGTVNIDAISMYFMEGVRVSIPWWLSLGALGIATGVGVISGIYPAWRATRMSPLEAIRSGA